MEKGVIHEDDGQWFLDTKMWNESEFVYTKKKIKADSSQ